MGFWQQASGILVLGALGLIVAIAYQWGKQGTIKKALHQIFDLDWK